MIERNYLELSKLLFDSSSALRRGDKGVDGEGAVDGKVVVVANLGVLVVVTRDVVVVVVHMLDVVGDVGATVVVVVVAVVVVRVVDVVDVVDGVLIGSGVVGRAVVVDATVEESGRVKKYVKLVCFTRGTNFSHKLKRQNF